MDGADVGCAYDVFLSYSHCDSEFATRLKSALIAQNIRVWLDKDEIRPGDWFAQALEHGINSSKCIAFLVSKQAVVSTWVNEEYYRALTLCNKKGVTLRLIPVLVDDAELPDFLSSRQCVDFRQAEQFDTAVEHLVWGISGKSSDTLIQVPPPFLRNTFAALRNPADLIQTFVVDYVKWFLQSLAKPSLMSSLDYKWSGSALGDQSRIALYLLFSIVIGVTIGSITPN